MASPETALGKRRKIKTTRFDFNFLDNEEQRLLQQALKISKVETRREQIDIPEAPVFRPSKEEFVDFISYIRSIRREGEKYGICKIIPPEGWNPPSSEELMENKHQFTTRLQQINTLQEGRGYDDGKTYTIQSYKAMADEFYKKWMDQKHNGREVSLERIIKDYWEIVETNNRQVAVEYGNDLDTTEYGSGFPPSVAPDEIDVGRCDFKSADYYKTSPWNLNNLPTGPGSVLKYVKTPINGINVPWLYIGMLFSSFCWHTEDNFFYSVNYSHFGAVKQWYGVPGSAADNFEAVSKEFLLGLFRETPDILHHMTTQISPSLLSANRVPVYKCSQEARTFIITFPRAFHGGFSTGFNVGEAVNFATLDWIKFGGVAEERYRVYARESVFSHQRLLFTLLKNIEDVKGSYKGLAKELVRVLDEEISSRSYVIDQGIRDISTVVALPTNNFACIDKKAADYDDMRTCCVCKQTCVLSAVACECDKNKVACPRHFTFMCKCSKDKKFLLAWASMSQLRNMRAAEVLAPKETKGSY